jgi:hypothetical protein
MSTKVRKQIYLEQRQEQAIKREAKARGMSEAEVIRRRLDHEESGEPRGGDDISAVDSFLNAAQRWSSKPASSRKWRWNRDELYDERLAKCAGSASPDSVREGPEPSSKRKSGHGKSAPRR